jgi:CxxC motif-containing protein (DUF1111 family)
MSHRLSTILLGLALWSTSCREPEPFPEGGYDSRLSGGQNTVFDNTSKAFGHAFPGFDVYNLSVHSAGDRQFEQTFVTAPAPVNSWLGSIFNNVSCISCHHNDGIGVPTTGEGQSSLLIRISQPGTDDHGGPLPVPGYGLQLQNKAIFGKSPECRIIISYTYATYAFADGTMYELRSPLYTLTDLHAPLSAGYLLSPRLAPPVFGLGLLEAVPARRNVTGPRVMRGEQVFADARCTGCHVPTLSTEDNMALRLFSNQRIHPYTDLLLHDMGPGLADNRPDCAASGREWRTAPLWRIGLLQTVNFPAYFLHDGRARSILEAIMWHDGEAAQSREYVEQLSKADRDALLGFLLSL